MLLTYTSSAVASCGDYLLDHGLNSAALHSGYDFDAYTLNDPDANGQDGIGLAGQSTPDSRNDVPCNGPGCRGHQAPLNSPIPSRTSDTEERWCLFFAELLLGHRSHSFGQPQDALIPVDALRDRIEHPPKV